jgi:tetratricopeptide (TPR) repeat protein
MPSNEKSNDSWWVGQNFISKDSTNQAIKALEPVVKKYDGKSGGEISQFLLARQYMEKGQFQKAIKNLEGVDVNDTYIRIYSIGLQGDCYSELKKYDTAIEKYIEAADEEDNEFTTPMYLLKAGLCAEKTKDYEAATTYYTRILDDYPAYGSQKTIEKYIARTSTIKKK